MALGGNQKLKEFLSKYGLNEEIMQTKYKSKAAQYFRLQLRCEEQNVPFNEQAPQYDNGREEISQAELDAEDDNQDGGNENVNPY